MIIVWRTPIILASFIVLTGCVSAIQSLANSPAAIRHLQLVSAGHTGCLPEDNQISNINASADGSAIWNASCNGKSFLCSAVGSAGSNAESYSCALAVPH